MGARAHHAPRRLTLALALTACAARAPEPVGRMVWQCPAPEPTSRPTPRPLTPALPALTLDNLRFRDRADCASGECRVEGASPFAPREAAVEDGATTVPPALAWVQVIRPGARVVLPRAATRDLLGVTLVGRVALDTTEGVGDATQQAPAWTAFLLRESGAVLRASGSEPAAALLVTATGPADGATATRRWVLRDMATAETLTWAGGAVHARLGFEAPASPRASVGLLFASDDAPVAEHAHAGEWEVLAALTASGQLHMPAQTIGERALPERDRTVTGGAVVYVPAGVRHAWRPDGTHPLLAVQVYSPPGPEQRFRALGRRDRAPQESPSHSPLTERHAR